jgi:hypothetical protein
MRENPDVHFPDEMTSRLCLGPRTAVSSIRKMNNNAVLGLNAQLGSFGGQQEEAEIPEISEELMLVMALQAQKKAALAPGSNVIVFGEMTHLKTPITLPSPTAWHLTHCTFFTARNRQW